MTSPAAESPRPPHPLDPLTADEIGRAWEILGTHRTSSSRTRVVSIALHEPPKDAVLRQRPGDGLERAALVVLLDSAAAQTYEAVVSLSMRQVVSWAHIPGVQPAIVLDEFFECEAAVRADPGWQAAMRKRGVTDFSLAMVDPWSAGHFGFEAEAGRRLSRTLTWVRRGPSDNGYARPVANVIAVVDLNEMTVVRVEDYGVIPLPPEDANYAPDVTGTSIRTGPSSSR